jgi:UDP-N-acetylglucosamine/UDP-N-acetylgalactosamine diphosphorylase
MQLEEAKKCIKSGKVGAIVLAGGQGTRLKVEGPKGCFPISLVRHKSLFQLLAEKVLAASTFFGCKLPLAIMTSKENHQETIRFFAKHKNFGLKNDQISFFPQDSLPLLDSEKKPIVEHGAIKEGACGNGAFFVSFLKSGLLYAWEKRGIEHINVMLIENVLNDPYDAQFLAKHLEDKNDVTAKAVLREDPEEPVGVFIPKDKQLFIVEYSELSQQEKFSRLENGSLEYPFANISFFCFRLPFVKKMAQIPLGSLPEHVAKKMDPKTDEIFYKREYFIFDVLPNTEKAGMFVVSRNEAFAPLKNHSGQDSPETVQQALLEKERRIFETISETKVDRTKVFELAMDFYYPTDQLKKKWRHKSLPETPYIAP